MGHLDTVEAELRQKLAENDAEGLVAWVKAKILESYRNGQTARGTGERRFTRRPGLAAPQEPR